jgi:tripartite-type tricarboxylate transporter receptor subunit TctC
MVSARVLAASVVAACLLARGVASAQTYPTRGATDTIARIIQNPFQESLGQPIAVARCDYYQSYCGAR